MQIRCCDGRRRRAVHDQAADAEHQTRATVGASAAPVRITRTLFLSIGLLTLDLIEFCSSYKRTVGIKHHNILSLL
jgi:hypothetical protein